jgi:hypothetical protein
VCPQTWDSSEVVQECGNDGGVRAHRDLEHSVLTIVALICIFHRLELQDSF